jgi:hypothetical protein
MNGKNLVVALRTKFHSKTDKALCAALGITHVTLLNWQQRKKLTPRSIADQIYRLAQRQAKGSEVVAKLQKAFKVRTLDQTAKRFGMTLQAVQHWRNRPYFSAKLIAKLVRSASSAGSQQAETNAIRPIVEFFPIQKCESVQGAKYELFQIKDWRNHKHPYLDGLRKELEQCRGIYIFFDSRGQAIYAGKARSLNLWKEVTNAFNRKRGSLQRIKRVRHPKRKQAYRNSQEKARQIHDYEVPLHDLAHYFSAYEVSDGLIGEIESLLVRSFANDLLNKRMEKFGSQQNRKHSRRKGRRKSRIVYGSKRRASGRSRK